MKHMLWISFLLIGTAVAQPEKDRGSYLQTFKIWGTLLHSNTDKMVFLAGFTNGYFDGRGETGSTLLKCMTQNVDLDQAIAMIDKYYAAHPERWNQPASWEIISALTVKDGPCPVSGASH